MKYFFVLYLLVLAFHPSVFAQEQSHYSKTDYNKLYKSVMDEYGFDQVLVNGIFYEDKYRRKIGHQFFMEDQLYKGTLIYKGKEYKGVEMKYDIFDQQLILNIKYNNSIVRIIPINDFISAFSFGNKFFSKYNFQGEPGFYQVVFDAEKLKCLYLWYKVKLDSNSRPGYSEFSRSEKKKYLVINGSFMTFRNKRSFIERFPEKVRAQVSKYIKVNHINVNKSSDEKMSKFLTYCDSLF